MFFNVPDSGNVSVEGEKGSSDDEDEFIYLFNDSTSQSRPTLHFPQEDDAEPGEYVTDSRPASTNIPPPNRPPTRTDDGNETRIMKYLRSTTFRILKTKMEMRTTSGSKSTRRRRQTLHNPEGPNVVLSPNYCLA